MTSLFSFIALFFSPFITGAVGTGLFGRTVRRRVPGLLFHSIYRGNIQHSMSSISANCFSSIIQYLLDYKYTPITISQACDPADEAQSTNNCLLTFDDGCRSFFTHVLPILDESGIKTTVFPVAGYLGMPSKWDIMPVFYHCTKSELRTISERGHEIGSHGMTHTDLTLLGNSDLLYELNDSKKLLEDIIGKEVNAISFPYGSWNERVWEQAKSAGYRFGTIYRKHRHVNQALFPVFGVYNFDTPQSVFSRIETTDSLSVSVACARMMSHFAKGAPVWKFDRKYMVGRRTP